MIAAGVSFTDAELLRWSLYALFAVGGWAARSLYGRLGRLERVLLVFIDGMGEGVPLTQIARDAREVFRNGKR